MYEFTKTITVDGTPYAAGDRVREADIPAGCFASLTRLRQLVPVPEPTPAETFAAVMEAAVEPAAIVAAQPEPEPQPVPAGPLVGPPGEIEQPKPVEPKPEKKPAKK